MGFRALSWSARFDRCHRLNSAHDCNVPIDRVYDGGPIDDSLLHRGLFPWNEAW